MMFIKCLNLGLGGSYCCIRANYKLEANQAKDGWAVCAKKSKNRKM
jgi:hypothetical protein